MSKCSPVRHDKELRKRVKTLVGDLVELFELGWLEIQIRFDEGNTGDAVCKSQCNWEYRRVVMNWNLQEVAHLGTDELLLVAVHELIHPLIEPLWDSHPDRGSESVTKVGELSTENVARVIWALL